MNFVIHARPYVSNSAGIRMTWALGDELRKRGHSVAYPQPGGAVVCTPVNRFIHVVMDDKQDRLYELNNTVRWILGYCGHLPNPRELTFTTDQVRYPDLPLLVIPMIDRALFKPKSRPGSGVVFYNGKGPNWIETGRVVEIAPPDPTWRHMTRHVPSTPTEVAQWLSDAAVLVCADGYSMIVMESLLCGTPVFLFGDQMFPPPFMHLGIFRDWEDFSVARLQTEKAPAEYDQWCKDVAHCVDDFVDLCRERFGD